MSERQGRRAEMDRMARHLREQGLPAREAEERARRAARRADGERIHVDPRRPTDK